MSCKYIYNDRVFNSELELNDFLLQNGKLITKFGDIVFERSSVHNKVLDILDTVTQDTKAAQEAYKKAKEIYYQGDQEKEFKPPYVGVNQFLKGLKRNNKYLFPEFIPENFWNDRKQHWKENQFTEDEARILFEDPSNTHPILDNEFDACRAKIEQRWKNQALIGTEIHKILQIFFTEIKSGQNKGKLFGDMPDTFLTNVILPKHLDMKLVNPKAIQDTLNIARDLYDKIKTRFGDNCTFLPEFTITGKVDNPLNKDADTLLGMIDLLVVDNNGNAHIIDYKTSPHSIDKYSDAKKLAYTYQIAFYNRMLEKYGINVDNSEMLVMPLQLDNFREENGEYVYDGVKRIKEPQTNPDGSQTGTVVWQSLKNTVEQSKNIQDNINTIMPPAPLDNPTTEGILTTVQETLAKWFPNHVFNKKSIDIESVKKELEAAKALTPDHRGVWRYKDGPELIEATSETELINKVLESKNLAETYKSKLYTNIVTSMKQAIAKEDVNLLELPKIAQNRVGINPEWLKGKLSKYCNRNWQILDCPAVNELGIIIVQNKTSGQVDFLKISSSNINSSIKFKNNNKMLSGNFQNDIIEESKDDSLMLQGYRGNAELMETMLVINQLQNLFNKYTFVGAVEVINPRMGISMTAYNDELLYTFKKMCSFTDTQVNNIQYASRYKLAYNKFADIMRLGNYNNFTGSYRKFQGFETCLSMMDQSMEQNRDAKLLALDKLAQEMESKWNLNSSSISQFELNSKHISLYNAILLARAELQGITFRQQIKENDAWLESGNILKNGIGGLKIDNPGNLTSNTLNLLTKLTTEAYQNVRVELQSPKAKLQKLVEDVKRVKSFGRILEYTVGNQSDLYKNMTFMDSNGNFMFRRIEEMPTQEEKNLLTYVLTTINKNRFPFKTDEQLQEMRMQGSEEYYQVPLCVGSAESQASVGGMLNMLKSRLTLLNPKKAIKKAQDKIEGINRAEETSENERDLRRSAELFEMGVGFNRGEGSDRLDYIKSKGEDYFEHNLEVLCLRHIFAYSVKYNMDKVFPMMKAAMAHIANQGSMQNIEFKNDIQYLKDYIINKIKGESIIPLKYEVANEIIGQVKQAASFMILALSPVQMFYQGLQGLWTDIRLILQKPDIMEKGGESAFTFKNMKDSFASVYKDLFNTNRNTVNNLLNELYGLNDMDMNQYIDRIRSNIHGIFNLDRFFYKFASRPDFYNRMTIFGAQMRKDGCFKAHSVKDGKLVYDWKLDDRFSAFANNNIHHPDYNKQKGLYYAMAVQFVREHAMTQDGEEFKIGMPLPRAYTNKQAEAYKSLADDIYGYYSHEKKSLIHSMLAGSMFMQFKTFWTGKKNQYLGKGGVKLRGQWVQKEGYYYQIDENGNVRYDLEPTTENTGVPFYVWSGQWQEGICISVASIFSSASPSDWKNNFLQRWYNEDQMQRNAFRSNLKQLTYDLVLWLLVGAIASALMTNWMKELKEETKDSKDFSDAILLASANIACMSVKNSFLDFNFSDSLIEPMVTWTPLSLEWSGRTLKIIMNTAFGDQDLWDGIVCSSSALKQIKLGLDIIKPVDID